MIEIGGEPRLKNGESPVNQPLDETLLPRNNRQLSSRPVFIINDGLPRFQGKFVIFRKVFVECGCDRPRAVPSSPIVRSLEAKEIEERGGERKREIARRHDFMGKIRLTLCLSSSPSTVWSLFLAFHSNELIPPPVEKLLDVLIPRLADSQSFWSIRYHARGEIAFLRIFARDKLEMSKYFIGYDIIRDIVNKPVREFVGNHEIFLFLFSNWFERRSRTTTVSNSIWEGKSGGDTSILSSDGS